MAILWNFLWNQIFQTLTSAAERHQEYLDQIYYNYEVQFKIQLELRVTVGAVERWGCWKSSETIFSWEKHDWFTRHGFW